MSCPLSKNLTGSTRYSSHNSCRIVRSNGTADVPVIYNNGSARNQLSVILILLCCCVAIVDPVLSRNSHLSASLQCLQNIQSYSVVIPVPQYNDGTILLVWSSERSFAFRFEEVVIDGNDETV
jgi:hypothetical protein